jgi:hypothetical protein
MSMMKRVSRSNPCQICQKPDWCMVGTDVLVCMRVASGRVFHFKDGAQGWLHMKDGKAQPPQARKPEAPEIILNVELKLKAWSRSVFNRTLDDHASKLGVSVLALQQLGCQPAPYPKVWAFPMRDGNNSYTGIRLRHEDGKKWAETGSHQGLFLPQREPELEAVICEGPTDTAAALSIGLFAIGRPTCNGGIFDINTAVKRLKIKQVTIIADCDKDKVRPTGQVWNPGISGAKGLADVLTVRSRIVTLPAKDMRDFVVSGGTIEHFVSIAKQLVWNKPK